MVDNTAPQQGLNEYMTPQGVTFGIDDMVNSIRMETSKPKTAFDIIDNEASNRDYFTDLFTPTQSNRPSFQGESFRVQDAYDRLSDGTWVKKFDTFTPGINNEEKYAQEQSTSDKWTNGIAKFFGKTGTAVLGGTVGSIAGLGEAILTGDWEAIYDNDFNSMLDDWNKRMDNGLANYYTEEEKNKGFLSSMGTANFWANDFLGGLSFTAGAIASEAIWAAATGGASLTVSAARWALRGADKGVDAVRMARVLKGETAPMKDLLSNFSKKQVKNAVLAGRTAEGLNTARYIYTSAGYEAGVEARSYIEEQKQTFELDFENTYGRKPTSAERADFESNLNSTANMVFASNLALVGSSNLAIYGKMFNVGNPISAPKSLLRKTIFGKGINFTENGAEAIKRNAAQRIAGTSYSIFRAPFIEGVYEEGLQGVASTSAGAFLSSSYDKNDDTLSLMESVYEGLSHTYGTKEGFKEVGLGMLIGMFGGGASSIATGRNPLSSTIDAARKVSQQDQKVAETLNKYSSKKLANEMFRANMINHVNKITGEAEQRGDLVYKESARTMGMLANITYAERMGYGKEVANEMQKALDAVDSEVVAKNLGITVEEADAMKVSSMEEYNKVREDYNKNKEFADYVIGAGKIKGEELNYEVAREAIAYQMTMGDRAEAISEDFSKAIMAEIGDFSNYGYQLQNYFEVQNKLRKSTKEDKKAFRDLQKEHRSTARELKNLEKQRLTQERRLNSTKEDNGNLAGALTNTTSKIAEQQQKLTELETQLEQAYSAMSLYTLESTSDNIILGKDLANIEDNLTEIEKFLKNVERTNPEKAARIKSLTEGYRSSLQASKLYSEVIEDLMNPETGLKGSTRTFLSKIKEYNDPTQRLVDNLKMYQKLSANTVQDIFKDDVNETDSPSTSNEGADAIVDTTENEIDEEPTVGTKPTLEEEINNLTKKNNYVLQNFGEDIESIRPSQEDTQRYEELLSKLNVDPNTLISQSISTISKRGLNKIGLTKEEIQEFKDLNKKLSDWRVVDGVTNGGASLAELIEQKLAYETEVNKEVVTELNENEELEVAMGYRNSSNKDMSSEMINTQETVLLKVTKKGFQIAHLKLADLVAKGATIKYRGTVIDDLSNLKKDVYTIVFGDTEINVKLQAHQRLHMDAENFNKLMDSAGLAAFDNRNIGGSNWTSIYERQEDGSYIPMETSFDITDFDSEFNILDPQSLYSLNNGDQLFFKLSLTDSFNIQYRDRLYDAITEYEANPSKENKKKLDDLRQEIYRQVNIYVVTENNDVVGQLKGIDEDVESTDTFRAIRKYASEILLNKYDPDTPLVETPDSLDNSLGNENLSVVQTLYSLPFTTKVTSVFVGSPNLRITNEEGKVRTEKVTLSDRALSMVKSFGIVENGNIQSNEGTPIEKGKINTQFIDRIEKPTPFIVIEYDNQKIAYPISLSSGAVTLLDEVEGVYNNANSPTELIKGLVTFLSEKGIDPRQYNIRHIDSDNTFIGSQEEKQMLEDLEKIKVKVSQEEFLSKGYKIENLQKDAMVNINLENKPFQNPKIKVDLKSPMLYTRQAEAEEMTRFEITGRAEDSTLESISNQLLSKNESQLSSFHKKVVDLYSEEINRRVAEKLRLSNSKKEQSNKEKNKEC